MVTSPRMKWFGLALLGRAVHGRARHRDRERRPAVHPARSRVLTGEPPVGDQRLRARLRRLPAARRAHGRPPRPAPHLPARARALHARLVALRARVERGLAHRLPGRSGARRGDDLAGRALDPDHDLPGGSRPEHRPRRLGRSRRLRRRRGRAARRRAHRPALVGVDLLRQHPGRRDGLRADPVLLGESRDTTRQEVRRARRGPRHRRALAARARHHAGPRLGLGLAADDRHLRRVRRAAGRLRRVGKSGRGPAHALRHPPRRRRCSAPTSPVSSSARRSSRCS